MGLEYGRSYLDQNEAALEILEAGMSPAAVAFAREQAAEMIAEDDEDCRQARQAAEAQGIAYKVMT